MQGCFQRIKATPPPPPFIIHRLDHQLSFRQPIQLGPYFSPTSTIHKAAKRCQTPMKTLPCLVLAKLSPLLSTQYRMQLSLTLSTRRAWHPTRRNSTTSCTPKDGPIHNVRVSSPRSSRWKKPSHTVIIRKVVTPPKCSVFTSSVRWSFQSISQLLEAMPSNKICRCSWDSMRKWIVEGRLASACTLLQVPWIGRLMRGGGLRWDSLTDLWFVCTTLIFARSARQLRRLLWRPSRNICGLRTRKRLNRYSRGSLNVMQCGSVWGLRGS